MNHSAEWALFCTALVCAGLGADRKAARPSRSTWSISHDARAAGQALVPTSPRFKAAATSDITLLNSTTFCRLRIWRWRAMAVLQEVRSSWPVTRSSPLVLWASLCSVERCGVAYLAEPQCCAERSICTARIVSRRGPGLHRPTCGSLDCRQDDAASGL